MADKELVSYEKSRGVKLTADGRQRAVQVIRRHRIWETFLARTLSFDWSEVHDLAEQLEHIQSDELINRLEKHLGYPKTDPHGDPIPDTYGQFHALAAIPLADATVGQTYVMAGVADHSLPFLHYLDKLGVSIGKRIHILSREEFDNSLTVRVEQAASSMVSIKAGAAILVLAGPGHT